METIKSVTGRHLIPLAVVVVAEEDVLHVAIVGIKELGMKEVIIQLFSIKIVLTLHLAAITDVAHLGEIDLVTLLMKLLLRFLKMPIYRIIELVIADINFLQKPQKLQKIDTRNLKLPPPKN